MQTPGTPLPFETNDSNIESPPLVFPPYESAEGHPTFLNYRNPEGAAIGGATGEAATGHSGAVNQTAYSDPTSSEFKHRKLASSDHTNISADPDRRRSSANSNVANVGLTSNGLLGNQKTGHDAVEDMSKSQTRSWSEQPLLMGLMTVGVAAMLWCGWAFLAGFNQAGKREMIVSL